MKDMYIIEVNDLDEFDDEFDLDKNANNYRRIINEAYKKVVKKTKATTKTERKLIRKGIEVGIGIANEMYEDGIFKVEVDYDAAVKNGIEEVIGETKVTDDQKLLVKKAIEAGIQANIKDIMVGYGRYYTN